ncbi:MAG TPA: PQQ-binding-like beta-propeller repeat protein [Ktedonobacteraceae bacterium]|nr:PQQ-binding-like beta-propeller repeat protein [Ktedonobacteraceae bacterium]
MNNNRLLQDPGCSYEQVDSTSYTTVMREPDKTHDTHKQPRHLTRRGQIILTVLLVVILLVAGGLYSQRHQLYQLARSLTVPPPQAVHITPLTLPPGTATPGQVTSADWTTYHDNNARTGFVTGMPDPTHLTNLWKQPLDGAVYAEPLVVNGQVIVATENDTLYALDAHTGQIQWHTNVGTPVPLANLPCGDIDPLGITGTPVYDPQTGLVFAVAEIRGPAHILVGLDVKTGQVKVRRVVDPAGTNPQTEQQRAALALYGGRVYVAFGGLYGDCGDYHGMVIASRTDGTGALLTYQVPTPREGGIWAPSGPVIDAQGNLYVTVGNGAVTQGSWDHTDSVLRLSPTLQLKDAFAPQSWQSDNASDLDLSSLGPVLLPDGLLFAHGKSNQGYLLHAGHLGGIGGQIQTISVCSAGAYGGAALSGQTAFIPCANGLREIKLTVGRQLTTGWQAPQQVTGSPVVGGNTVYSLDPSGGMLYALDAATSSVRATISVGTTSRFATPTLSQGSIFVGTMTGIVALGMK